MTNNLYKNERVWQNNDHPKSSSYNDHRGPPTHPTTKIKKRKHIPSKKIKTKHTRQHHKNIGEKSKAKRK